MTALELTPRLTIPPLELIALISSARHTPRGRRGSVWCDGVQRQCNQASGEIEVRA